MMRRDYDRELMMREARKREEAKLRSQVKVKAHVRASRDAGEIGRNWLLMILIAGLACKFSFLAGSIIMLVYGFYLMYCFEQDEADEFEEESFR